MDDDESVLFRHPWEDDDPDDEHDDARRTPPNDALVDSHRLLIPLARAQDAVARLETLISASPDDIAFGTRARMAFFEASGFLAHIGPSVHPHDLALRASRHTGSYVLASYRGQISAAAPWTALEDADLMDLPDDRLIGQALGYARQWRQLAERVSIQPLATPAALAKALQPICGAPAEDPETHRWLACLPSSSQLPGLLAAAGIVATGLPGKGRGDAIPIGATYAAAALWRGHGYGRPCALPFWSAPVSHLHALARRTGVEFRRDYLGCVAEAALRGAREVQRLHAVSQAIAELRCTRRSRLPEAATIALREPVVTGSLLARRLNVSVRSGLSLALDLSRAGVMREMTGRSAWRVFGLV